MEVKAWTYDEFPEFTEPVEGAHIISTSSNEMGTEYIPDVEYINMNGTPLHLQILLPSCRNDKVDFMSEEKPFRRPCVVFVQGSAWMPQNVYAKVGMISKLAERGYVCAIVEYRHSGIAYFPAQADDALKRYAMLHDNGSLPEVQWVEVQSKVAQAKSQLEVARKNLRDCRLVAPVSGIIGRKQVGAGETAMPSQAVVTILDVSRVKVRVAIPEAEIGSISANTSSVIRVEAINSSFVGGRIEKGVQADALTHTYDIRINVANSGRKLLPGMVANVQFAGVSSHAMGVLPTLPVTAIQKKADGSLFVWTVDKNNAAHRTPVTIGETQGNRVSVTSGVGENERVVTEGYQKLSEGTKVVY